MSFALRDPAEFHEALERHPVQDLVIVDFDETLWLRNSTEMFLDSVRPRFLAALVLQFLGILRPWRFLRNGDAYRDWIRVVAVLAVAPWSLWRWRREAVRLGPKLLNRPLMAALSNRPRGRVAIVTLGFREIVRPLLESLNAADNLVESCSLRSGAKLRIEGKASALERSVGPDQLRRSIAVTDSIADADLLKRCGLGFLVKWPGAHYEQAGLTPLMPFVYLERVKRPDEHYLRNAVLGHDLPVLLLAFAWVSSAPLLAALAILIYVAAFFTAYEIGYHENDRLGLRLESKPKVSAQYHLLAHHFSPRHAWAIAIVLAGLASLLAAPTQSWLPEAVGADGIIAFLITWGAFLLFLLVTRLMFRWQNVIEPQGRIVPMLGLQVGRVLGYAIVFPTTVIGAMFCVAHGLSRWLPYVVYRFGGSRREVPNHLNALMLLMLFGLAVVVGGGGAALLTWQSAAIFVYAGLRAAKDLLSFRLRLRPLVPSPVRSRSAPPLPPGPVIVAEKTHPANNLRDGTN